MTRIRPLEMHEVDADIRDICAGVEHQTGTSASTRTLAHHPGLVKALAAFRAAMAKEGLVDPAIKELVRLKIARVNACHY